MDTKDYDRIATSYDIRFKKDDMISIINLLRNIITTRNYKNILEFGCGTGKWISEISAPNFQVFGIDLSLGMLNEAKNKTWFGTLAGSGPPAC
jgi:predicted TPR repeat methyltransferase